MKQLTAFCVAMLLAIPLRAELTIEITQGVDNPLPIAVVPFGIAEGVKVDVDMAEIVENDLRLSGEFRMLDRNDMLSTPDNATEVFYRDWRAQGMDYVLVARIENEFGASFTVRYALMDVNGQKQLLSGAHHGTRDMLRGMAHAISDDVYEALTSVKGAFSTKLLYVSAKRTGKITRFRLLTSDIDGYGEVVLLDQTEPILSPAWAPDGERIAYVSYESTRPAVYMHNLRTGERRQLTNFRGLNQSPAWAPDGRRLALVLSKDGSPDIYVLDTETSELTRVTRHFSIDTEPAWMPDGKSLIFTSDRGGKPQIYNVELRTGRVQRLTFEGDYNARARVLPDGRGIVMVHRAEGSFRIAVQDFQRGTFEILTDTVLDESPSVAPNGSMLLYATSHRGQGVLAAVSLDGQVHYRLPSRYGDVREPAWSPFLK